MRERVNSPRVFPGSKRLAGSLVALSLLAPASAGSQPKRERPFLFGGGQPAKKDPVQTDPWLPTGALVPESLARPATGEVPGCSFRAPVCVHRGPGVSPGAARDTLEALESAYHSLVEVLRLPRPTSDRGAGGTDALDLYLTADPSRVQVGVEPVVSGQFDRAAGFCTLGDLGRERTRRDATLCVGEAIALALDPAETPHLRRAYATHLWGLVGTPTAADLEAVDEVQAHPERALATRELGPGSEGAALLFEYLDARRGIAAPGTLATLMLSVAVTKTEPRAVLWNNSPDVFDALRRALDESPRDTAQLFADLAVTRGFLGARDDGEHLPALEWTGSFGRPRFDWSIKLSSLPRRVAALRPIDPLGALYVWLELDQSLGEKELGFQAEWESPVSFQWAIVSVGAEGEEIGRIYPPFVERGRQVEQTLSDLKGARGLLIVGTNLGGVSLSHPFDPDYAPFEPHGCTVYLTKL